MRARGAAGSLLAALLGVLVATTLLSTPAAAASEPTWRFEPAEAPPPPPGGSPASFPLPLGKVGDIEFWAPNRGLLITSGTGPNCAESTIENGDVPCGLYAYNGVRWHLLSTVCGGSSGRIAWAGPDEFWTISDQRRGQVGQALKYEDVSLCHFLDGQVVGSYALPLGQPDSYQPMDAAGCLSPEDCWFGGGLGTPPNSGSAFHLHWDGQNMSVFYETESHAVNAMTLANQSTLLESVAVANESNGQPSAALHQIEPPGLGVTFESLAIPNSGCLGQMGCASLPEYGTEASSNGGAPKPVDPATLAPFSLSSDYYPSGANAAAPQVWAVAGPNEKSPAKGDGHAHPIVLRYSEGVWKQVVGGKDPGGDEPFSAQEVPQSVAAEPGVAAAWVTVRSTDNQAHVDRLSAAGTISERDVLGEAQGVGNTGVAGAISCPAPHECWLATNVGWLYHLTSRTPQEPLPEDTDPNFAGVISFRPIDGGVPQEPPAEPQEDDSLLNQAPPPPPPPPTAQPSKLTRAALITQLSSHILHRYTLALSFTLTVKAHVQLLANHGKRRVAQTALETLEAGKHTLRLRLNPHRWPNKLNLKATPLEALPTVEAKGGSGQTVAPPISENSVST